MQSAVEQERGGPVEVYGSGDTPYVLMSMEVYRELMGVGSEADFSASVQAVERGYQAAQAGQSRSFRDALDDLGRKNEIPR